MHRKTDRIAIGTRRAPRRILACGASALALGLGATAAQAQETEMAQADTGNGSPIIVTGSRIRQDGMQTPVPVTAVQAEALDSMAPTTLVEGLSQLPQFYGNQTPNDATSWFERGGYGNLNLRGLGINRTLTLLNGRRIISANAFGGVDTNVIPEALIASIATTTGGASAAYGTDAVAGVVNFILDTDFDGLELTAQAGITSRGDSEYYEISGAFGTNIGSRGHFLISAERFEQEGVHNYDGRDWYNAWGTVPDANGQLLIRPNVISNAATFDGLIFAPGSAIDMLQFRSDGTFAPFMTGSPTTARPGVPPARSAGGSGDDIGAEVQTIYPDIERDAIYAYADYEVADGFTMFAQYIRGSNETFRYNTPRGSIQGTPTAVTIFQDNAYLPDAIRQTMITEGLESFTLRRQGSAEDIGADITLRDRNVMNSVTAGFQWDLDTGGFLDDWTIDAYYQYGHNQRRAYQVGLRVDRLFAAVDAVVDPATGSIVCRTSLFNDQFPGCQPLNLFGRGNATPGAVDYVTGNDPGEQITTPLFFANGGFGPGITDSYTSQEAKVSITTLRQHVVDLSFSGELWEGWGAGPISAAFGASYREDRIRQIVRDSTNQSSDHVNGHPVLCDTDPEAIAAGLRGVNPADCANTVGVQYSKVSNILGSIDVKEAFGELLVPLIADAGFIEQANLHLTGRWADYSGSGTVWAYKAGLDLQLGGGIRLRGTYSRDVRAANLSERFDRTGGVATITDPRYPGDGAINVTRFSGGNPNVNPEEADTFTVGAVFQPEFIDGLSISLDWYRIEIGGAIGQLGVQAVVNQCEAGATDLCSLITRDIATDRLVLVGDVFINVDENVVSGVDLEVAYQRDIALFGGGGEAIGARLYASWLDENSETLAGTQTIDRAGQTGLQQSDGIAYALPDFKATGSLTYNNGGFSAFVQGRYIDGGTIENALVEGVDIERNSVSSAFYADARLSYEHQFDSGTSVEIFGQVTNLFDEDPPITPYYSVFLGYSQQYNPSLFDVLGRRYTLGVRVRM
ncbi:TonB-dependent receptor domain-containing protein [Parasphingopyxis marina]|uniref:TonB-dependent receptor n=1 Tax=Parasphingopyxis marina TaxID=2761622 RepID=A0A842HVF7_9SPHN|nr:TonB-dependent receptor [Parasphingopyxis marina]MBC2777076.1 TonB-dependent receptor [Parasphingopyxis marina]